MSLHNINLLQNPIDVGNKVNTYSTTYTTSDKDQTYTYTHTSTYSDSFTIGDKYLVQSLANLGQRTGLKGDSIIYKTFTFLDAFENEIYKDPDKYIGKINFINNECEFSIVNIDSKIEDENNSDNKFKIDSLNSVTTLNDKLTDININNIDLYSKQSILSFNKDKFISMVFGKKIGTEENDKNNQEILYTIFNSKTNELDFAVRAYYLYNDNISNYYLLFTIERAKGKNGEYYANKYNLYTYLFNSSTISNIDIKNKFEEAFTFINTENSFIKYLKDNYNNIDKLFHYDSEEDASLFGFFKYHELNNELNGITDIVNLSYDTNENELLSINLPVSEKVKEIFGYDISLSKRVQYINNDIIYLYPAMLKYYSEMQFTNTPHAIYSSILFNIYNYINKYKLSTESNCPLYVPLDYIFTYTCNSNNELNIYNSTDIFITLTKNLSEDLLKQNKSLIYNYDNIDKIKNICFTVNYNNKYQDYISNIDILEIYTLPYITNNYTWNINDADTKISVLGKDAGNPNIIMIYNYVIDNKLEYNILSGANLTKVNNSTFEETEFILNSNITSSTSSIIKCRCKMPIINKSNEDIFKYSLVFVLCDKSCIKNNNVLADSSNMQIFTSIWKVISDEKELKFDYIRTNELSSEKTQEYALDISYLLNIDNIIHTYLDSIMSKNVSMKYNNIFINTNKKIYNQESSEELNNYGIITNNSPIEYKDSLMKIFNSNDDAKLFESMFKYKNQFGLNIKYDDVTDNNVNLNTNNQYINSYQLPVSNTLYPIYEKTKDKKYTNETAYLFNKYESRELSSTVDVVKLKSNEKLSTKSIYKTDNWNIINTKIPNRIKKVLILNKFIFGKKNSKDKLTYFYNEYLPSNNTPIVNNKEVLLANNNMLNRLNIISLDKDGKLYNSYIGTQYDVDTDKKIFTIGSSNKNINIGSETLMNYSYTDSFTKQNQIDINFNDIKLNGNTQINGSLNIEGGVINKIKDQNNKYYSINESLCGKRGNNILPNDSDLSPYKIAVKNKNGQDIIGIDSLNYEEYIDISTNTPKQDCDILIKVNNSINQPIQEGFLFYKYELPYENFGIIYINLNLILNKYLTDIFNTNLDNKNIIFDYYINNTEYSESENINNHNKIIKLNNTYLLELSCENYGNLSKNIIENENKEEIYFVLDNVHFILSTDDNNIIHIKYISKCAPFFSGKITKIKN